VLDAISIELEQVEERIFAKQTERASIEALYGIKQKLMTLKHATEPLLEAVGRLHGGRVPPLCLPLQDYFRDVSDHLVRLNQSIDSLRDMVTTAISVSLSLVSLQENDQAPRRLWRLVGADYDRWRLRHEFSVHAGNSMAAWLSGYVSAQWRCFFAASARRGFSFTRILRW
jgi:hypothetical protein